MSETPPAPPDWTKPDRLHRYHRPSTTQAVEDLRVIREEYWKLACRLRELLPQVPERTLAERALHDSAMHALFARIASEQCEAHPSEGPAGTPSPFQCTVGFVS